MTSFGEPLPDSAGELRLQLHHTEVQREAFRALGHRDVQALIREALASHLSEMCEKLRNEITRMEGENHRLREALEQSSKQAVEVERLKALILRLENSQLIREEQSSDALTMIAAQRDLLRQDVERLESILYPNRKKK